MLKFYYKTLSLYSRPVWIALLEKQLSFEAIDLALDGDQWQPEFLAINPFGRVPVLVDGELSVFESLAILNYLELQYPNPTLVPADVETLTTVKMVEMLTLHELIPAMLTIVRVTDNKVAIQQADRQIVTMLSFLEKLLIDNSYLAGDRITLADIVAGSIILWLPYLNISLSSYPEVKRWSSQLMQRQAWQVTQPNLEVIQNWLRRIKVLPKVRQRQWQQRQKK